MYNLVAVGDDEAFQELLKIILEDDVYNVKKTNSVDQSIELLNDTSFNIDAFLVDWKKDSPSIDTFVVQLKKQHFPKPVILFSPIKSRPLPEELKRLGHPFLISRNAIKQDIVFILDLVLRTSHKKSV